MRNSFYEASARERVAALVDAGSFREFVPPEARLTSPHMAMLDQPVAFDDGLVIGAARLEGRAVLVAAQEGAYLGGAIGEVHGAKLVGLIERARAERPAAVLILFDSGGVRLHEANAGLIAVSEIIRAVLGARAEGLRFIGLIGGASGCFGGTGLIARCCDALVMSEEGRLAMSGPEVIETVRGVEEFDARDRALVWRVTGGKHRYLLGEADRLVADDIAAFRAAAAELLDAPAGLTLEAVEREHAWLAARWARFSECDDAPPIWQALGVPADADVAMLGAEEFVAMAAQCSGRTS
jgi:malonate decarboxylase beta subunit